MTESHNGRSNKDEIHYTIISSEEVELTYQSTVRYLIKVYSKLLWLDKAIIPISPIRFEFPIVANGLGKPIQKRKDIYH